MHKRKLFLVPPTTAGSKPCESSLIEPASLSQNLTTTVIDTEAGFLDLQLDWDDLLQASVANTFFLTWEWLYTWWKHLAGDRKLHIVAARHDGQLVALAPLAYRPSRWLRLVPFPVLEFLGCGNVGSDYLDVIVRNGYEDSGLRALTSCLVASNRALELSHVRHQSTQTADIASQLRELGWHDHRATIEVCPYIALADHTWDSYLAALGRTHRTNFKRKLKKLQGLYTLRIDEAQTDAERRAALDILVNLHLKRRREVGASDALHTRDLLAFHEEMTSTALRCNWLRLHVMWLDNVPVAAMYGFEYDKVFYFYQSGFDMDYGNYSVGLIMAGLVIKSMIERGIREFDFLHGDEGYKYLWTSTERELVRFTLFPGDARGSLCKQLMLLRGNLKRMLKRPPGPAPRAASGGATVLALPVDKPHKQEEDD
jgi:CelD/BcsL family acetyltransferase involved in cellulose biosynthesis